MRAGKARQDDDLNRRWRPALMSFFMRRVYDRAEAEDLTQEVFLRLIGRDQDIAAPDGYVFQIAANLLRDRARRAKVRSSYREATALEPEGELDVLDPHRIAMDRQSLSIFVRGVRDLPDRTQTIFVLYRMENMSLDMIAESFGISKSAAKKHVAKAMALLMRKMREGR